jgi:hypothetical protein
LPEPVWLGSIEAQDADALRALHDLDNPEQARRSA